MIPLKSTMAGLAFFITLTANHLLLDKILNQN